MLDTAGECFDTATTSTRVRWRWTAIPFPTPMHYHRQAPPPVSNTRLLPQVDMLQYREHVWGKVPEAGHGQVQVERPQA